MNPPPIPARNGPPPLPLDEEESFPTTKVVVIVSVIIAFLILLLLAWLLADHLSGVGRGGTGAGTGTVAGNGGDGGDGGSGSGAGGGGGSGKDAEDDGAGDGASAKNDGSGSAAPEDDGESRGDDLERVDSSKSSGSAGGEADSQSSEDLEPIPLKKNGSDQNAFFVTPSPQAATPSGPARAGEEAGSAEFFGASAEGNRFAYVIDVSGSMAGERFEKAREELLKSIKRLKKSQSVYVVFYNDQTFVQPRDKLCVATQKMKNALKEWIALATPQGGTDPLEAITRSVSKHPDAVFVLSDGEFGNMVVDQVTAANKDRVPIHTIGFRTSATTLQELAERNRGTFSRVD
ncbi:von Willebrand factor type A domain protein [Botrimarina colliarenosi]|uniref:von Willebrand factor type A domain protein n=1 Tax=Botrimarina colliarenosi TaxID=2528001 RepID=A0A5C6AK90_9BACT|nr:VWA domain-containing protein [Botrimarina colliarenosi]TWU00453.1 von Willebrand factor type A domain protein [Botrimarina colliarenosi]